MWGSLPVDSSMGSARCEKKPLVIGSSDYSNL